MKYKYWLGILALALLALPLAACSSTPAEWTGVTLKFAYTMPQNVTVSQGWHWWAEELEDRTDGKVQVEFYPGGSLFALDAAVDSVTAGVADIAMISIGGYAQRFPLSNVGSMPTASFPDSVEGLLDANDALNTLIEEFPEVAAEWTDFKLLGLYQMLNYIPQSKMEIRVPSNLDGVKMGGDGLKLDFAEICGAVPITTAPPDMYTSLQTGLVDAGFLSWSQANVYHSYEVVSYFMDYGFGATSLPIIMNLDSWNAIPTDVQEIMMELIPQSQTVSAAALMVGVTSGRAAVTGSSKTIVTLTPAEIAQWQTAGAPLDADWLDEMDGKGLTSADDVLARWKELALEAWE